MVPSTFDVAIIGAGAVGASLAREMSRYSLRILLLDAADDVATGATSANSGIVHGGYAAKAGTLKAKFSLKGNRLFGRLSAELDFPFRRCGGVVLGFNEKDLDILESLRVNGETNGLDNLEMTGADETIRRIPRLNPADIKGGLFSPGTGIVSPYEYAIALIENAISNGVQLQNNSRVTGMERHGDTTILNAGGKEYRSHFVVNASGVETANIAGLVGPSPFRIIPKKGQYIIFRRGNAAGLNTVVFQPPTEQGKGILVTPTVWGNLLIGPDAQEVQNIQDHETDPQSLARIMRTALRSVSDIKIKNAIRTFSGIRPTSDRKDFIIEWSDKFPRLLHLAGIESPGLTASPAIALEAAHFLKEAGLSLKKNPDFNPERKALVRPGPLASPADAAKAAKFSSGDPRRMLCRCEQVKESTVLDALSKAGHLRSTDSIKRRTRAGMGACQGAFCGPRVRKTMAQFHELPEDAIKGPRRERSEIIANLTELRKLLEK